MSHMVSAEKLRSAVTTELDELRGQCSEEYFLAHMGQIVTDVVKKLYQDVDAVALEVVKADLAESGYRREGLHKIYGIRDILDRTDTDLRTAKEAWERAVLIALRDHADEVLTELKSAVNGQSWTVHFPHVDAMKHAEVLTNLREAYEGNVPF